MELDNKVAIVTGGSSGIGRAIAELFAQEGANVVVADTKQRGSFGNPKDLRNQIDFARTDVRNSNDAKSLVDNTVRTYGAIDILCNNAGIALPKPFVEITEQEWDDTIATNLKGVFLVSKCALPFMIRKKKGVIINIASQLAFVAAKSLSSYCASKAGVVLLTKGMALEYASMGIRVNCICPGAIDTNMLSQITKHQSNPDKFLKTLVGDHPLGRPGKPHEIAQAALFLASEKSSFMTGSAMVVDGGYTIH